MIIAEILGPDGATLSRVKLDGTCVVGSDRSCGLVLVDPTVAPRHLELLEGPGEGTVTLRRLADDGETRVGSLIVGAEAEVTLPATVSVGAVAVRLSSAAATGPADMPPPSPILSRPATAWALCLVTVVLCAAEDFLTTDKAHPWHVGLGMAVGSLFLLLAWAGGWAIGNRLFGYRNRFHSHLSAISIWVLVAGCIELVATSAAEVVHTDVTRVLGSGLGLLLFAALLYLHIRVASRWRPRTNATIAVAILVAIGSLALIPSDSDADEPVKGALTSLTALPAAVYVTRPADGVAASTDKILHELNGMKAKRSVKRAPEGP
ncbi:MAG: FHA domain-containing protein [Gemmatimonadetes bacterium]|nr:FHA domain-containing protein [Gemmatimonadota bacterium]